MIFLPFRLSKSKLGGMHKMMPLLLLAIKKPTANSVPDDSTAGLLLTRQWNGN